MAEGGGDPRPRITLEVDNESALPKLLEGRTVAIIGGPLDNYTVESREPERRLRLHDQLRRARALRARLEEAADRADSLPSDSPSSCPRALEILQSSLPDIHRLVRLTEAIRGKHDVEEPECEYEEWNDWTARRNEEEEAQRRRERRALRRQLREFAKEKNPGLELDEEIERRHDSLIARSKDKGDRKAGEGEEGEDWKVGPAGDALLGDDEEGTSGGSDADYDSDEGFAPLPSAVDTDSDNDGNVSVRNPRPSSIANEDDRPMRSLASPKVGRSDKASRRSDSSQLSQASPTMPPAKRTKVGVGSVAKAPALAEKQPAAARKNPPETMTPRVESRKAPPEIKPIKATVKEKSFISIAAASSRKAPPKSAAIGTGPDGSRRRGAGRPPKKCHHCKVSTTRYRNCNYWKLTGKCRKVYCVSCLTSHYTLGADGDTGVSVEDILENPAHDAEWHCPSCLGACACKVCMRERRKEEERERSRTEAAGRRERGRRSAANAGNSYSYFF